MRITAIIIAYWPSRYPAIPSTVKDLQDGTLAPDHIIVLNNNHRHLLGPIPGVSVINCGWNYTSRAKYAAAMLEPSDYYLLLDDDVSVHDELLEYLAGLADPDCCMSDSGGIMQTNYATARKLVRSSDFGRTSQAAGSVDIFSGSLQFVSFRAIVRMFEAEAVIRLPNLPEFRSVGEDLLIAMANPSACVFPTKDNKGRESRPQGKSAMALDHGYFAMRNWFAIKAWVALGNKLFDGPVPNDLPQDKERVRQYLAILKDRDETGAAMENKPDE